MSSKWSSDDEEKPSGGHQSPITPFSPPSEQKQGSEKRPRRPRLGCGEVSAEDMKNEDTEKPPAIVRTITGGWGLDVEGSAAPRDAESKCGLTKIGTTEGKSTGHGRRNHFDNEETEILIIPDLEDDGKEDITSKVAAAPKNATRRVPTLRELDEDLKYSVPSAVDGLDMSLLTRTLVPPEMLEGDDTPWDFDSLLQIVIQEYNAEKITGATGVGGAAEVQDSTGSTSSGSRSARSSRTVVA